MKKAGDHIPIVRTIGAKNPRRVGAKKITTKMTSNDASSNIFEVGGCVVEHQKESSLFVINTKGKSITSLSKVDLLTLLSDPSIRKSCPVQVLSINNEKLSQ